MAETDAIETWGTLGGGWAVHELRKHRNHNARVEPVSQRPTVEASLTSLPQRPASHVALRYRSVTLTVIASSPRPQKLLPNLFKYQWLRLPANARQPNSFWEVGSFGVMVLEQNVPCHSTLCRDNKTNPKKSSIHILGLTLQTPTSDVCKGLLSPAKPGKSKIQNHQ